MQKLIIGFGKYCGEKVSVVSISVDQIIVKTEFKKLIKYKTSNFDIDEAGYIQPIWEAICTNPKKSLLVTA